MVPLGSLLLFAGTVLLMVLTPGPNMLYLVSRSISQGARAGVVSLVGVTTALVVHMLLASIGVTALLLAVPVAFTALKAAGALYLLYLAWQAVKPGARAPFEPRALTPDPPARLFRMGFLTCALNPKVALIYLSILPQFVSPAHGSVFTQSLELGTVQIGISVGGNLLIALSAAGIAGWFAQRPAWTTAQRWFMGSVLSGLALRMALERR